MHAVPCDAADNQHLLLHCACACLRRTPESEALSAALKKTGMVFVGPTIMYAFMQAAGLVNDHLVSCHCRSNNG